MKRVVIIGAGNVGFHLGVELAGKGYRIEQVFSRNSSKAEQLANRLEAKAIDRFEDLVLTADLYVIAVKDDALVEVSKQVSLGKKIVVHTSGTVPMEVLKGCSEQIGVFYPLQTFSGNEPMSFEQVPLCVEGNSKQLEDELFQLARSLSKQPFRISSEARKRIHLAAVFACNFTNHMYAISNELLSEENLDVSILSPLIEKTTEKILKGEVPKKVQTGPAAREDIQILQQHEARLKEKPTWQKIYRLVSQSIIELKKT